MAKVTAQQLGAMKTLGRTALRSCLLKRQIMERRLHVEVHVMCSTPMSIVVGDCTVVLRFAIQLIIPSYSSRHALLLIAMRMMILPVFLLVLAAIMLSLSVLPGQSLCAPTTTTN